MNRLVIHHKYANGMAFDLSGCRNHGFPYSIEQAAAPLAPGFLFTSGDSRVIVEPSATLQDLMAVRAVATFYLSPPGGIARRYNLIEGHLCFALFVNPDASLSGTIVDAAGNWSGTTTAPGIVSSNEWHTAEFRHDGMNLCTIFLDGSVVGIGYGALGPVESVGPHGVAIGHWPELSGQYTFDGCIRETWVYKYDPSITARHFLSENCCGFREELDSVARALRSAGVSAASARETGTALIKFGLSVSARSRGSDPADSKSQNTLCALALAAFKRGDSSGYAQAMTQLALVAATTLSRETQEQIHAQAERLFKLLPLSSKQWQLVIDKLCLGGAKLDPSALVKAVQTGLNDSKQSRERGF